MTNEASAWAKHFVGARRTLEKNKSFNFSSILSRKPLGLRWKSKSPAFVFLFHNVETSTKGNSLFEYLCYTHIGVQCNKVGGTKTELFSVSTHEGINSVFSRITTWLTLFFVSLGGAGRGWGVLKSSISRFLQLRRCSHSRRSRSITT